MAVSGAGLLLIAFVLAARNVGLVLAGVAFMVDGVFDHLLLVRTLSPARG